MRRIADARRRGSFGAGAISGSGEMAHEGVDPTPSTPEAFSRHLSAELQRWTALVDHAALKVR
jgi:hypothetical protein